MIEKVMLSKYKGEAVNEAKTANLDEIPANLFLEKLLQSETETMIKLHTPEYHPDTDDQGDRQVGKESKNLLKKASEERDPEPDVMRENTDLSALVNKTRDLQTKLQQVVLGQQSAVSAFIAGFFNSELQAAITKKRKHPRGTFLFAI